MQRVLLKIQNRRPFINYAGQYFFLQFSYYAGNCGCVSFCLLKWVLHYNSKSLVTTISTQNHSTIKDALLTTLPPLDPRDKMLRRVHPCTAELKYGFTYKFLSLSLFLSMQQLIISIFLLLFLRFCFSQPHQPLVYLQKSNKVNSSLTIDSIHNKQLNAAMECTEWDRAGKPNM